MFGYVKFIGWAAAFTSATLGVMISLTALWILVSGQSGDGAVTINGIIGVGFLVCGFWIAGWVEKCIAAKENDK